MIRTRYQYRGSYRRNKYQYRSSVQSKLNNINCSNLRYLCFKYRAIVYCFLIAAILYILHRNFLRESYLDRLFQQQCIENTTHHSLCSFIYGFIENIITFILLSISFIIFFPLYWKLRYLNSCKCCENLTFLDPFIMSFPWFLSPLFSFHSITSLIINICIVIQDSTTKSQCDLIRTFWSFLLWFGMDLLLWSRVPMIYLFEKGPNKIFNMILPHHFSLVQQILLPHLYYINDLVELILSFEGNHIIWKLLDMKQNLNTSLSESNLSQPFYYLTIITVIISTFRLLATPEAVRVLFPMIVVIGIIIVVFVIFIILMLILSILTGGNVSHCNCSGNAYNACFNAIKTGCCDKSAACRAFSGLIGGIITAVLWGSIIWKVMNRKLRKMNDIQAQCKTIKPDEYGFELYVGTAVSDDCQVT